MYGMSWHGSFLCRCVSVGKTTSGALEVLGLGQSTVLLHKLCLACAHQDFSSIFSVLTTWNWALKPVPTPDPQVCVQKNFSSSVFRKQTLSHTEFLPALSPSLSNLTFSCSKERSSSCCSGVLLCFVHQHILQSDMVDEQFK